MTHRLFLLVLCAGVLTGPSPSLAAADIWERLPAETVYASRIPAGGAALDQLVHSDFGQLFLGPEPRDKFLALLREEGEPWPKLLDLVDAVIGDAGLSDLFAGESGLAMLRQSQPGTLPRVALVAWWHPSAAVRGRWAAVEAAWDAEVAAGSLAEWPRTEFDLAGRRGWTVSVMVDGDQSRFMVLPDGPRLFLAFVQEQDHEAFEQQLSALLEDAVPAENFRSRVEAVPGLVASLPAGPMITEAYIDVGTLLHVEDQEERQRIDNLGFITVGPIAARMTLHDGQLHSGSFVSLPAPRKGLPALLEQPPLLPEPPAWVPKEAITYDHLSLDLNVLWNGFVTMWRAHEGDEIDRHLDSIDQYMQATFQADLATVLGAFGNQIIGLRFPDGEGAGPAVDDPFAWNERLRMAWSWEIRDEEVAKRVMTVLGSFMMMGIDDQEVRPANQGRWSGYRIGPEGKELGGAFLGHGQWLVCIGDGVLDEMMAAIEAGEAPEGGLVATEAMQRSLAILPGEPGIYWSMQDAGLLAAQAAEEMPTWFDQLSVTGIMLEFAPDPVDRAGWLELVPDPDLLGKSLGLAVTHIVLGGQGLRMESVWELRSAEQAATP